HEMQRRDRWRIAASATTADTDFAAEERLRLGVLELLYSKRRLEPNKPGVFPLDLEKLTGRPREHLEFTLWYLAQKKLVQRSDNSMIVITADGIDYLEERYDHVPTARRLAAVN